MHVPAAPHRAAPALPIFTGSKTLKPASLLARNQKLTIVDHMADGRGGRRGLVEHVVKRCKGRGAGTVRQRGLLHRGEVTTALNTVKHPSVKKWMNEWMDERMNDSTPLVIQPVLNSSHHLYSIKYNHPWPQYQFINYKHSLIRQSPYHKN